MPASKALLIWTLLAAAVMAPIADIAAFGLHDHISGPAASLTTNGADAGPDHHCDFWMSPGTMLLVPDVMPLVQLAALHAALGPLHGSPALSVPASPPRA